MTFLATMKMIKGKTLDLVGQDVDFLSAVISHALYRSCASCHMINLSIFLLCVRCIVFDYDDDDEAAAVDLKSDKKYWERVEAFRKKLRKCTFCGAVKLPNERTSSTCCQKGKRLWAKFYDEKQMAVLPPEILHILKTQHFKDKATWINNLFVMVYRCINWKANTKVAGGFAKPNLTFLHIHGNHTC